MTPPPLLSRLTFVVSMHRVALLLTTVVLASTATRGQVMVLDETYQPQFRTRADIRLYPQTDGNLAATGADYLGDDPAPSVFRISPGGTVLQDNGPEDTSGPSPLEVRLPDGRRVLAVVASLGWEMPVFHDVTTYGPTRTALHTLRFNTIFPGFGPGGIGSPLANSFKLVAAPDGQVYAGGDFTMVGDQHRIRIARIRVDGTLDPTFIPLPAEGFFRDIVVLPDHSVVIATGGSVITDPATGQDRATGPGVLTRIRADGTIDSAYVATLDDPVLHFALPDGRLIVGGTTLQRVLATGALDPAFNATTSGLTRVLRVQRLAEGTLLVAGARADGSPSVVVLSADGALIQDLLSLFPGEGAIVLDGLDLAGNAWVRHGTSGYTYPSWGEGLRTAVVDGVNARVPVSGAHIALYVPFDVTITPTPRIIGGVSALHLDAAGRIYLSGAFDWIDGHIHDHVARLNGDGTVDHAYAPTQVGWNTEIACVHGDGRVLLRDASNSTLKYRRLAADGTIDSTLPASSALATESVARIVDTDSSGGYLALETPSETRPLIAPAVSRFANNGSRLQRITTLGGMLSVRDVVELADRRLLVAGTVPWPPAGDEYSTMTVVRLLDDGTMDSGFHLGLPPETLVLSAQVHANGTALANVAYANTFYGGAHTIRILEDGSIDSAFRVSEGWDGQIGRYRIERTPDGRYLTRFTENAPALLNQDGSHAASFQFPGFGFTNITDLLVTPAGDYYDCGGFFQTATQRILILRRARAVDAPGVYGPTIGQFHYAGEEIFLEIGVYDLSAKTIQWQRDGVDIVGATSARLIIDPATVADSGSYRCIIHVGTTTYVTDAAVVTVAANTTKLINFSARSRVEPGRAQVAGMVIEPGAGQPALLRAIGSALPFELGVPLMPDPELTVFERETAILFNRGGIRRPEILSLGDQLGAFRPRPVDGAGSALATTLAPGLFTAHTASGDGRSGVSLFEFYDAEPGGATRGVSNISIRGVTGPGSEVLIAGFVVSGAGNIRLLIRAIGPTLAPFGVSGFVDDPRIVVRRSGTLGPDATNNDWAGAAATATAAAEVGAFPLPADSKDAAFVVTLPAGAYTVQIPAAAGQRGEALCEIYVLDN